MSKQIAVMMCAINIDNQRKLLEGMIDAAKETDNNLFIFSNYVSFRDKVENIQGAYQIMELPDFRQFDGAIFARNTIQYPPTVEYVTKALLESGIPTASIDAEIPGMSSFGILSFDAQLAMVEHAILHHGCKEMIYVSGPRFHAEAKRRYDAYCAALEKHGLEYKEENVYEGFFTEESGQQIAKEILKRDTFPHFIVCGNDAMAVGIVDYFKKCGIQVPEDVQIVGFDNAELSELQNPSLTSVNKRQYEVGYRAVMQILALMDGAPHKNELIPCSLEIRHSCGCKKLENFGLEKLKDRYVHGQVATQRVGDIMRNMIAEFSGLESPEDLEEAMKNHISQMDLESFYLCMCERDKVFASRDESLEGSVDIIHTLADYTDKIHIPVAYENGEFRTYDDFDKGLVLPEECRNRGGGNYYVVVPIYYQRGCYGYCVTGNSRFPLDSSLFYSWVVNIGIGLENIRKFMLLKETVVRLNGMWVYDTMTKLYNRAGFYYHAKKKFAEYQAQNEKIYLMFIDVDGLKPINDNMGHEAGDRLICEMAEVIKQTLKEDRIAMRYGGDEFVVFGKCHEGETEESLIQEMQTRMWQRNMRRKNPFDIKASIGNSIYSANDGKSLEEMIEFADKKMYEEKRKKREMRNKENG